MRGISQQSQTDWFRLKSMRFKPLILLTATMLLIGCGSELSGLPPKTTKSPSDSQVDSGSIAPKPKPAPVSPAPVVPTDPVPSDPVPSEPVPVVPTVPVPPEPVPKTPTPTTNTDAQTALQLVNAARSKAQNCGGTLYPAVPAVVWNSKLENAARAFNQDMISKQYFDHISPDGSTPGSRVEAQGYVYTALGENIALGSVGSSLDTVSGAVQAWLTSTGHCKNIMNANYTEMGLVGTPGKWNGTEAMYWTQELARPN
jgi:uncharacterized protein YkwD